MSTPPRLPENTLVGADDVVPLLERGDTLVVDFANHAHFVKGHIPDAWWALRSQLHDSVARLPKARTCALTCESRLLAAFAAPEFSALTPSRILVLDVGNRASAAAGRALEAGAERLASPPIDRYRRPYEGTDNAVEAMQAHLNWEYGLVEQLARDGTHHFRTE